MSNNLTLSVTLTGDGKQLSGTLKNAQGEVQAFGGTTEREGGRAERSLANVERRAGTVGRELQVLRRLAAPVGAALAGMFATRALQGQVDYADQLQKTNLRIGASVEALSQYNHVASLSGVAFGNLTTAWQRQTRRISEAAQGTGAAKDALEALGLSAKELNQLAPEDQFERIAEALQGVESQADRTALAMKLWDTEGVSLLQITNQGTDAIRAMREEADRLGLTISQDTADAMANYNDEMARFQAVATGVTRQVASELVPAMTTGLQTASEWVDQMGGAAEILDTVKDAGTGVAVVLAGRYVGAIAASQAALTAKAAIAATTTGTLNLLTGATTRQAAAATAMAGATRVATGAMTLLGGPLGLLVGAGGLLYAFREELGLVRTAAEPTTQRIDNLTDAIKQNSVAAVEAGIVTLATEYFALGQKAASATAEIERLTQAQDNDRQGAQARLHNNMRLRDMREELAQVTTEQDAAGESIGKLRETLASLGKTVVETTDSTTDLADANETAAAKTIELSKSTEAQSDALEDLYNRLIPGRRETVQLARDMQTLTLAMAMGTGNIGQNIQAMGLLQQQYIEAQRDTDDLADKTVKAAYTMEGAWDEVRLNGLRRLDDGFADLWEGAIDGSLNAGELMKKALAQTLAEMAHMAITRPITVQLATSMGLNGGAGGGAGGGFNGIGSLINGGKSLLGIGGGSTAAAAGGLYSGASTGAAMGGLYGNAVTGGVASTGIMSSITAGVSAAMPWIAGGLAIDSLLGGGITKAIGKLFGGGDTPFYGEVGSGSGIKAYRTETALGETGFTQRQRIEKATSAGTQEWAAELFEASKALDTIIASTARSTSELDAMKGAVNNFKVASGDASKLIQAQLVDRTLVALEAAGHNVTAAWGNLGAEELAARIEQATGAMSVMSASSERLNLQFDVTSSSALRAADNMAQYAGGVQNLASLQDQYFQRYFSDTERAAALQADLTASLNAMGLALPQNEAGFRALVEAQDQNTDAGGRNYVQLLQLSNGFAQLQDMLGQTETGVRDFTAELSAARDAVSTAEDQVRRAYAVFDRQSFDQQITLLGLLGDSESALALERERELATIDESLRPTQERIWAIQDEIAAQQNATQAARNYQRELTRVRDQLNQSLANVGTWLDQQLATSGTPESNLATAQEQLARQLVLVESGDRNALQNITQYAQQVLDANRDYNASSAAGQRIQQDVFDAIAGLPAAINAEQYLADEIRTALFDALEGKATDSEIKALMASVANGDMTIESALKQVYGASQGTEANTDSLEKQARDQLKELNGLVGEMTRATDQFVGLNATMVSLRDAIIALGVAQDDITRIEEERAAAEQAERERISTERTVSQYTAAASSHMAQSVDAIGRAQRGVDAAGLGGQEIGEISKLIERYAGDDGLLQSSEYGALRDTVESMDPGHYRGVARTLALAARHASQAAFNERDAANVGASGDDRVDAQGVNFWDLWQSHLRFAKGGVFTNSVVDEPTSFAMGLMGEAGPEAIMPLKRHSDGSLGVRAELPAFPQFPALNNSDIVETLRDLKRENQQLRADLSRLLERISDNTHGTANAVASSAQVAERQRQAQLEEQRAATRASRIKGRVL